MTDVSPKELARRAEQLPEDATLEDAMERLYCSEKIEQGEGPSGRSNGCPRGSSPSFRRLNGATLVRVVWSETATNDSTALSCTSGGVRRAVLLSWSAGSSYAGRLADFGQGGCSRWGRRRPW